MPTVQGRTLPRRLRPSWASLDAASRSADLANALSSQDRVFLASMREMQVVRDFVGTPENILGSATTKHGEIAEQVNVAIIRARDILLGRAPTATFEGVGRFAPTDYRVGGVDIQSKYYNGLRNTLDGVLGYTSNHPGFASGGGEYHIPRDQYDQIRQLHQTGRIDGLSDRSTDTDAIRDRLGSLQQHTGRPADDLIAPGETDYREVQQGRVHDTIRDREGKLAAENDDLNRRAQADYGPSLAGLGQAAAIGATVGGRCRPSPGGLGQVPRGQEAVQGIFLGTGLAGHRSACRAGSGWRRRCRRRAVLADERHTPVRPSRRCIRKRSDGHRQSPAALPFRADRW